MISITALSQYLVEDLHDYFIENPQGSLPPQHSSDGRAVSGPGFEPDSEQPLSSAVREERGTEASSPFATQESQCSEPNCSTVLGPRAEGSRRASAPYWGFPRWSQEAQPVDVAAQSLVASLSKKFRDEVGTKAEDAAYYKFLAINDRCKNWQLNLQFSWEEELVGLLKQEIDDFFHPGGEPLIQTERAIWDRGRCGPGASLGANGVDFYTKLFSSDLTATSFEVYYQYAEWCAADPKWRDAEFDRLTSFGLPSIISESKVTFVPKNRDTLRTICTEPNLNMFAQLGLGALLEDRLQSRFGIDFSVQPERSAELARLGSIAGAIDTIDLESASDSLSLSMLATILPEWVYDTFLMYRSPNTIVRGEQVKLHMISTMGNGTTFPLQTIVFSCVVQAVAKQMGASMRRADLSWSPWGVFGDDIACPSFMTARVVRLLEILGFQVNREKSFTDKYLTFRESCGYDYFRGHNVRGVYLKTLRTPQSRCVAVNLLNEWSARWGIPLRRSVGYLRDSVRILAIPPWVGVDAGIRVPLMALRLGFVHVYRSNRWRYSYLFRCYEPVVPSLRVLDDVIAIPRNLNRVPRRAYNPSGLLIAAIGGYLKGGRIPLALKQGESPNYRTKTGVTPFWGPTVEQVRAQGPAFWERWNTVVLENLFF